MRAILEGRPVGLTYSLVTIAEGTEFQTIVRDVRGDGRWATPSYAGTNRNAGPIVYHHTAGGHTGEVPPMAQLTMMELMRGEAPWGLPYNFVVFPHGQGRVWYLNDVDQAWPHTYGFNRSCAIAAWGNYSEQEPDPLMVKRMLKLADALAHMWGRFIPEYQHRDVVATECPGNHLSGLLPAHGRQR